MATQQGNPIQFPKFNGKNYTQWKFRMDLLLEEKQMKCFVENTLAEAIEKKDRGITEAEMILREKKCKSLLAQAIDDEQLQYVMDKDSAKAMYDALVTMFQRKSITSQLLLRRRLLMMKFNGADLQDHFAKFDKLIRELKFAGAQLIDMDIIVNLFLTLPNSFDVVITSLESMDETKLTLDYVKGRLMDEFAKKNGGSTQSQPKSESASAMQVKNSPLICYGCGEEGHIKSRCNQRKGGKSKSKSNSKPNFQAKKNSSANCASSGKEEEGSLLCAVSECGQATAAAFTSDGNNNNSESIEKHSEDTHQTEAQALKSNKVAEAQTATFVLDSGATDHMANNKDYFDELSSINGKNISVAKKNERISVHQQGDILVKTFQSGDTSIKTMKDVLYSNDLKCNLMSIRRLTRNGYKVVFENDDATVMKNDAIIFIARAKPNGLYEVELQIEHSIFAGIAGEKNVNRITQDLWHFRLGHVNVCDLKKMIHNKMVNGIDAIDVCTDDKFCEPCVLGKHSRLPYNKKHIKRSKRILELIHSDVCGPLSTTAIDGSDFFVSFVDDYSRASMIYCIKHKSDVKDKFVEFVEMAEAKHGCKVSKLRADNGGEYTSNALKQYCTSKGIHISYTVPYNPQMNGIAERLNRTLQEKALSMLVASGMQRRFWNEAILTANYIKNRLPTSAFGEQFAKETPAEIWYGQKPNLSNARIFGSTCYNHIPSEKRSKLEPKASKCLMLGYQSNNTYRLWDIDSRKVVIGRNVTFNEKSILHRAKVIEIFDSEAASDSDEGIDSMGNANDDNSVDHSADENSTGDSNGHSTNSDGTGNNTDTVHSADPNGIGNNSDQQQPRRSNRERRQPQRYGQTDENAHFALSAQEYVNSDPESIEEAKQRDDWHEWKKAIDSEYDSLMKNNTWTLCDLPKGRKAITGKWVFKLKHKANGEIDKYKARFVARGCSQKHGFDYAETYAPVAKLSTLRILLSIANRFDMHVHQMDVKGAFLNGDLDEDIYMVPPEGFPAGNKVCKLNKAIYGLKQSSRMWYEKFHQFITRIGFKRCSSDYCLYTKFENAIRCYILLYVDDLLIVCDSEKMVRIVKELLAREFEMTDIGIVNTFLGIHIEHDRKNGIIQLGQSHYMKKVINKFGMNDCKPASTPIEKGLHLSSEAKGEDSNVPYRELIGCLTYATLTTRPDLCASTNYFSRFQSNYTHEHFTQAKRILRYIKATIDLKMRFVKDEEAEMLVGYADSDWAGDKNDSKSTSGYVFKLFGNTVSWATRKQSTVAQSSTEAEYVALGDAINEAEWIKQLLIELGFTFDNPIKIYEDNQSCIKVAQEPREHKRMKHVAVKYDFIRDSIKSESIQLEYIPTGEQAADIMTKGLGKTQYLHLRSKLNLN